MIFRESICSDRAWMDMYGGDDDSPIPSLERLVRMELSARLIAEIVESMWDDFEHLSPLLGDRDGEPWCDLRQIEVLSDDMVKLLARARDEAEGRMSDMLDVPDDEEAVQ